MGIPIYLALGLLAILLGKKQLLFGLLSAGIFGDLLSLSLAKVSVPAWILLGLLYLSKSQLTRISITAISVKSYLYAARWFLLFAFASLIVAILFTQPFFLSTQFPASGSLLWSQGYTARSIISASRLVLSIFAAAGISSLLPLLGWKKIIFTLCITANILFVLGLFFLLSQDSFLPLLFPDSRLDLFYRMHGMCGEPRAFGQSMACLFLLFVIVIRNNGSSPLLLLSCLSTLIGILGSLSATSIIAAAFGVIIIYAQDMRSFFLTLRINSMSATLILLLVVIVVLSGNAFSLFESDFYGSVDLLDKISATVNGSNDAEITFNSTLDSSYFEQMISRFEVFDRLGLRVLLNVPVVAILGAGPNAISIPAGFFVDQAAYVIYGSSINSVPHIQALNFFLWMGVWGLPFLFITIFRFLRLARNCYVAHEFLSVNLFLCLLISPPSLFLSLAFAASLPTTVPDQDNSIAAI